MCELLSAQISTSRTAVCCLTGLLLISLVSPCQAADPARSFEELYSADLKKISASKSPKDCGDFAQKLFDSSLQLKDDLELKEYVLNKACDFAMKDPASFKLAVNAVETLMSEFEGKRDAYREKLLSIYQARYENAAGADKTVAGEDYIGQLLTRGKELLSKSQSAGNSPNDPRSPPAQSQPAGININIDAINEALKIFNQAKSVADAIKSNMGEQASLYIKSAGGQLDIKKRFDDLSSKYTAKPGDPLLAKGLALLCLLELDDPTFASIYAVACTEEALKKYIPMAAKPLTTMPESSCMELAGWYNTLAATSSGQICKLIAYNRCKSCLTRFLSLHTKTDAEQQRARKALTLVSAEIVKLDPAGKGVSGVSSLNLNLPQKTGIIWTYNTGTCSLIRVLCSPDGKKISVTSLDGFSAIIDVETKKEIFKTDKQGFGEAFTDDSKVFLVAGNGLMNTYEADTGKQIVKNSSREDMASDVPAFSGDGRFHCGFKQDKPLTLDVVEVQTGRKVKEIPLGLKGIAKYPAVGLSPNGKLAIVAGLDEGEDSGKQRFCKIIDIDSGKIIQTLACSQVQQDGGSQVFKVSFLPDGRRAVDNASKNWLTLWDFQAGKSLLEFRKSGNVWFAISFDGGKIAVASYQTIDIIDTTNNKVLQSITLEPAKGERMQFQGSAMCFSPDGKYLFAGFETGPTGGDTTSSGVYLIGVSK